MWYTSITYGSDQTQYGQLSNLATPIRDNGFYHMWISGFPLVIHW